jgi:broad specificity phosphatase PhoE
MFLRFGESCADVFDRVSDFMNTMFRDFEKKDCPRNVVVVSHGMTLRLFIMRWFHTSIEEFESWGNQPNCSYLLLERGENEKYVLTTPMKVHKLRHSYQFDWSQWTRKYTELGSFKVPHKKLP